jgi:hypothetical protein
VTAGKAKPEPIVTETSYGTIPGSIPMRLIPSGILPEDGSTPTTEARLSEVKRVSIN